MSVVHILTTDKTCKSYLPFDHGKAIFRFSHLAPSSKQILLEGPIWIFVDWVLEDLSGLDMIRRLRADSRTSRAHITMVLEADDESDKRRSLRAGADDYVIGPIDRTAILDRVLARINSRPVPFAHQVIERGPLVIDIDGWRATWAGQEIDLTPHEFRLLRYFAENSNRAMSREEIIEALGRDPAQFDARNVDAWVRGLRAVFRKSGLSLPLRTVRAVGYVFDG